MIEHTASPETVLEVDSPGRPRQSVSLKHFPFLIGRGRGTGNHLSLEDRRISRNCAAILEEEGGFRLEDRGNRTGLFINGKQVQMQTLKDGDTISFGFDDSCTIHFHSTASQSNIENLLTRLGSIPAMASALPSGGLSKLNLLLEATSLLSSQLPLDSALGAMLDHAISITHADRSLLLEPDAAGSLRHRLARNSTGENLPPESISPSQTALTQALEKRLSVVTGDLNLAEANLQTAHSVVVQRLRLVVAIPLYAMPRAKDAGALAEKRGELLGAIYLDSKRPAAFSDLDLQILDALGMESASILDNARLVERERERQRMEQELTIARQIQQALLPQGLRDFPHLAVTGVHYPCHAVGGDYFDVFPVSEQRTAILISDVAGKGLGAALLTTMLQGALSGMTLGADPVRVFNHINRFLCEHSEVGRYATMFFGLLDCDGSLEYIRAGHPSPLLLRNGEVSDLCTGGSFPVGLLKDATFTAEHLKLEPEDTLILFSDGVSEAEDVNEEMFGVARLKGILAGRQNAPLDELKDTVLDAIHDFSKDAGQSDDVTLLVVRYRAAV
jgi:sigma-B regulation protein RsbU (phosphoserine phosphatase)